MAQKQQRLWHKSDYGTKAAATMTMAQKRLWHKSSSDYGTKAADKQRIS